uniref:Uncharacterized protein n=1 Tax=viral metagenome TaxID=1070528 RepID=A0A6C0KQD7_9ZZZZ
MDNKYHEKINNYVNNNNNNMYIFEVSKCCGYSEFVPVYKNDKIIDLFSKIMNHFNCNEIKDLFFYTHVGVYIRISISNKTINEFVMENTKCNPPKLVELYPLNNVKVYNLFLDDGICDSKENCQCQSHLYVSE